MAVHWTIKSEDRLFEVVCDGLVEDSDIHRMLDVLVGSEALGYRKLFDGSRADTSLGPQEILDIGVRLRSLHADGAALGALAVVIPDSKYALLARVLGILATARRPMRIFNDPRKARTWLNSQVRRLEHERPGPMNR